ncbi:MAG: hypothetical protein ACK4UY_04010 [Dietzia sp.]
MVPDTRDEAAIVAATHAYARVRGWWYLVRGIDRFSHWPDRTPTAVVWVADQYGMGKHRTEEAQLSEIRMYPGRTR